jgi:hypothetical protein
MHITKEEHTLVIEMLQGDILLVLVIFIMRKYIQPEMEKVL